MMNPLPKRLKELRIEHGYSQATLGVEAGIGSYKAGGVRINHYENGNRNPDWMMVKALSEALNCPAHYFYVEDDSLAKNTLKSYRRRK